MNEYTFGISYFSEATLQITISRDGEYYSALCRHPMTANGTDVPLGGSWFHFTGPDWDESAIVVQGHSIRDVLDTVAETFWEGSKFYFTEKVEDEKFWFRQHIYIAFTFGYLPSRDLRIKVVDRNL